jgi:hypothetical protein
MASIAKGVARLRAPRCFAQRIDMLSQQLAAPVQEIDGKNQHPPSTKARR